MMTNMPQSDDSNQPSDKIVPYGLDGVVHVLAKRRNEDYRTPPPGEDASREDAEAILAHLKQESPDLYAAVREAIIDDSIPTPATEQHNLSSRYAAGKTAIQKIDAGDLPAAIYCITEYESIDEAVSAQDMRCKALELMLSDSDPESRTKFIQKYKDRSLARIEFALTHPSLNAFAETSYSALSGTCTVGTLFLAPVTSIRKKYYPPEGVLPCFVIPLCGFTLVGAILSNFASPQVMAIMEEIAVGYMCLPVINGVYELARFGVKTIFETYKANKATNLLLEAELTKPALVAHQTITVEQIEEE